jgi:hypothetical protein
VLQQFKNELCQLILNHFYLQLSVVVSWQTLLGASKQAMTIKDKTD